MSSLDFDFELEVSEQYGRRTGVSITEDGKAVDIRQQNCASIGDYWNRIKVRVDDLVDLIDALENKNEAMIPEKIRGNGWVTKASVRLNADQTEVTLVQSSVGMGGRNGDSAVLNTTELTELGSRV